MKYVLVILGKRTDVQRVVAQFKEEHPDAYGYSFTKILIGPERVEKDFQSGQPDEWVVRTPEMWRKVGEDELTPLETYIRRRMKGGDGVEVHFINLDPNVSRQDAVTRWMKELGWRPFKLKTLAAH